MDWTLPGAHKRINRSEKEVQYIVFLKITESYRNEKLMLDSPSFLLFLVSFYEDDISLFRLRFLNIRWSLKAGEFLVLNKIITIDLRIE